MNDMFQLTSALATVNPDSPFLEGRNGFSLSRGEAFHRADRIARVLVEHGLQKGDHIAIRLGSTPDAIIAKLACWRAGFPCFTFGLTPHVDYFSLVYDGVGAKYLIDTVTYSAMLNRFRAAPLIPHPPMADDALSLRRTSGTTGTSKIVKDLTRHRLNAVNFHIDRMAATALDKIMFFQGQNVGTSNSAILMALLVGIPLVAYDPDTEQDYLTQIIEEVQPTLAFMPPSKAFDPWPFEDFLNVLQATDTSSLRFGFVYGAMPNDDLTALDQLMSGGCVRGYSMTESAQPFYCRYGDPEEKRLYTYGTGYDPNVVRIADGELQIHADYVSSYLRTWEYEARITPDGFFKTFDAASWDADGYLLYEGRIDAPS